MIYLTHYENINVCSGSQGVITTEDYTRVHFLCSTLDSSSEMILRSGHYSRLKSSHVSRSVVFFMAHIGQSLSCSLLSRFRTSCESFPATRGIQPILLQCWANVFDAGPTLKQYWLNAPCMLGWCDAWYQV